MSNWLPMFALPNIEVCESIEVDGFALVSLRDIRLESLARKYKRFGSYLRRFKTEFGNSVRPSIIIWRDDTPNSYRTISAISAFRDAISMSIIPYAWALALRYENNSSIMYSDYFNVYPWMIDKNFDDLVTKTMAVIGVHEVKKLRAQSTAGLTPRTLQRRIIDSALLNTLLTRWQTAFSTDHPAPADERLFRSLNMANAAALLPAGADVKLYDIGRSVALWVSAFEILAPAKALGYTHVYDLLEKATWNLSECSKARYEAYGYQNLPKLRILPCWIYGEINRARNDFLHGSTIIPSRLIVAPGKQSINLYTAPLYRMALTSFLDLKFQSKESLNSDPGSCVNYQAQKQEFGKYQRDIEVALSTIMLTQEECRKARSHFG